MSWIALLWREDSVNSSRKLVKLKHLAMELYVMVESFCLWNVCNKNNKALETYTVSLYFLSLELLIEKVVEKTFWGFVYRSGNHFTVTTVANKNRTFYAVWKWFVTTQRGKLPLQQNKHSINNSWFPMNTLKLLFWL